MAQKKILIADNDRDFLETRSEFLKRAGFDVIPATSPEQARKKLVDANPDVAILDIRLLNDDDEKDISGLELAREIGRLVPVLLFTGYPSLEYARQALKPQLDGLPVAHDFILKQDGPEALLIAIRNVLRTVESKHPNSTLAKSAGRANANLVLRALDAILITIPRVIGRATLDLFGRDKAVDSTAIVLGYIIIGIIILGLVGIVDLDKIVNWFMAWWRFFFPVK